MTWVVDASVAVKWYIEEEGWQQARSLLSSGEGLAAPDLIVAEVCNVAWRLARSDTISHIEAFEIADAIGRDVDMLMSLSSLASRAAGIAAELDHPVYDCFYLALAERLQSPLVTADRRLLRRAAATPWQSLALDLRSLPTDEA